MFLEGDLNFLEEGYGYEGEDDVGDNVEVGDVD